MPLSRLLQPPYTGRSRAFGVEFGRRAAAIDGDRQALDSSGTYRDIGEHAAVARKRGEHEDRAATQHLANEPAPQNRASLADADTSRLSLQRQVARRTA